MLHAYYDCLTKDKFRQWFGNLWIGSHPTPTQGRYQILHRDIFKKFKGSFERIFITGVSPVTLDDVTSGFNIGWHISTKPEFNQMLGFSTEDVREIFAYYQQQGKIDGRIVNHFSEVRPLSASVS